MWRSDTWWGGVLEKGVRKSKVSEKTLVFWPASKRIHLKRCVAGWGGGHTFLKLGKVGRFSQTSRVLG